MKVKCPSCKDTKSLETTDKYRPDVTPNGSFVRCVGTYAREIDWLTKSTTLVSEMTCPNCSMMLAPANRLTVVPDPREVSDLFDGVPEKSVGDDPLSTIQPSEPAGQSGDSPIPPIDTDPDPSFQCDVCEAKFTTKFALTGHKRSHAVGKDPKPGTKIFNR